MVTPSVVVTIARRFVGPPTSGNGGYTAGLLAEHVPHAPDQPVTVTLRRPPPLETPLRVMPPSGSGSQDALTLLLDGDAVVAEAGPGEFAAAAVEPVTPAAAHAAESSYEGLRTHPFPTCFVCGTERAAGDGLRLAPGPIAAGLTACVWTPDASLVDASGRIPEHFVWAALDCPSAWTSDLETRPVVLGRLTARCDSPVSVGTPYVVVARLLKEQGRKTFTASALYDAAGVLVARAEHVWIAIDPADFA
ncbi:MAG: hypothetical protein WAK18_08440 [Nocardioidaceae bacterium]